MKKKRGIVSIVLISIIAVIFIIPLIYMVSTSLKPKSEVLQNTLSLIGSRVTTENYERAWNAFPFARYMFNSIFVGLVTTALTVFTSAMAAYAFARLKFKGRDKVFFVYLSTLMVPIQVTIIPLYMILRILGWHDSYAITKGGLVGKDADDDLAAVLDLIQGAECAVRGCIRSGCSLRAGIGSGGGCGGGGRTVTAGEQQGQSSKVDG